MSTLELPYNPITDFGLVTKRMVIGSLGIIHAFVALLDETHPVQF